MVAVQNETLVLGGVRHHFLRAGPKATPLLLLHGFMASGRSWRRVADVFASAFEVVMPDARGHGRSDGAADGLSFAGLAGDAAGLIEALRLDRPIVVGHSMGAGTAATLAATRPDLVRALVLVDPAMRAPPPPPEPGTDAFERWYKPFLATLAALKTQGAEERQRSYLDFYPPAAGWHPTDIAHMAEAHADVDPRMMERPLPSYRLERLVSDVARVSAPVLLVTGDPARGSVATPEGVEALRSSWQDGRHVRVAAGHLLPFEAFDEFVTILGRFLDEVVATP